MNYCATEFARCSVYVPLSLLYYNIRCYGPSDEMRCPPSHGSSSQESKGLAGFVVGVSYFCLFEPNDTLGNKTICVNWVGSIVRGGDKNL